MMLTNNLKPREGSGKPSDQRFRIIQKVHLDVTLEALQCLELRELSVSDEGQAPLPVPDT